MFLPEATRTELPVISDKRPVSIFLLVRSLELGGAERQLVLLATGLHERGYRVQVAVFYKRGPLVEELDRAGVAIIDLGKRGRWDLIGFVWRLRQVLQRVRPDLVYSFLGGANIMAAAAGLVVRGVKIVWSIRAADMDLSQYDWTHRAGSRVERWVSGLPDLIIANSVSGRDYAAQNGFPVDRIAVVPNGIDTAHFRPDAKLRAAQRARWGLRGQEIGVGVLARLDPMKGQETFLRAAAIALRSKPELRFLCIGEGPDEGRLKALAAELQLGDRVLITGVADPVTALNALDVACSPSFTEGFSNAIAEAMACGIPCIVTNVGDSARIVGKLGIVVPRSHPSALANAILKIVEELPSIQKKRVRARIVSTFSAAAMVEGTIAQLNRLSAGSIRHTEP